LKALIGEAIAVIAAGCLLAIGANALSPRGISLSRNYFPSLSGQPAPPATTNLAAAPPGMNGGNTVRHRLASHGIQLVDSNYAAQAFQNPGRARHQVMFVDARTDADYQRGHIPGAYQLDYYRPEPHLPMVLPAAQVAATAIIYCNGGDCEDSELAALLLRDSGVPAGKLHVYGGGFAEWVTNGMPVETGAQNSGAIRQP
jgi:rhodanese-related sulfurtransferase